jgi:hypothetical protein
MTERLNTTEASAASHCYDITNGRPYVPGAIAARNCLTDPKSSPESRKAARELLGYTDPMGWPTEAEQSRTADILASAALIAVTLGVTGLVVYVLTLPGVV